MWTSRRGARALLTLGLLFMSLSPEARAEEPDAGLDSPADAGQPLGAIQAETPAAPDEPAPDPDAGVNADELLPDAPREEAASEELFPDKPAAPPEPARPVEPAPLPKAPPVVTVPPVAAPPVTAPPAPKAPAAGAKKPAPRLKLAFSGIGNGNEVTPEVAGSVAEYVQSSLIALQAYDVIGAREIQTMLGLERQKQLVGCSDDSASCLAEIAGALDADRGLTGEVARIESSVILNLSLIDLRKSKPIARVVRRVKGTTVEPLLDEVPEALVELVKADPGKPPFIEPPPRKPAQSAFAGLAIGLRTDVDVKGPGASPALTLGYSGRHFGLFAAGIWAKTPGVRLEGRFFPVEILDRVRPYALAGVTAFGLVPGARAGAGTEVKIWKGLHGFADASYERFFEFGATSPRPVFRDHSILVAGGASWTF